MEFLFQKPLTLKIFVSSLDFNDYTQKLITTRLTTILRKTKGFELSEIYRINGMKSRYKKN